MRFTYVARGPERENKQCADLNKCFKNLTFPRGFLFIGEMSMVLLSSSIILNELKIGLVLKNNGRTIGHVVYKRVSVNDKLRFEKMFF